MSEDKEKNLEKKETVDEKEKKIGELEAKLAVYDLQKQQSDDDLYSEEFLDFKKNKNKVQQKVEQGSFSTGSRMNDFTSDQLKEMELPKLVELIAKEVYINVAEEQDRKDQTVSLSKQKEIREAKREEAVKFAADPLHYDLKKYIAEIAKLEKKNPNLSIAQLYKLAKEDEPEKKGEPKPIPNTRDEISTGVKKSDENLSYREIIKQEYDKLQK